MNKFLNIFSSLLLFPVTLIANENKVLLSGCITDINGNVLPYTTVRIVDATVGTISDSHGKYELLLTPGVYRIIYSYVGYKPDTAFFTLFKNTINDIYLEPVDIQLPAVVIDGEDPAYPIIREAIRRKIKRREQILSYTARTYTKDTFGRDTSLSLISEAYSDLYYEKNNPLKEIVIHRRQSSNLSEEFQLAAIRDYLNFNDDTIRHWGYTFITPLADTALHFYDYKLRRTYTHNGKQMYDIEIFPMSQTLPLFSGVLTIEDSSFALKRVNVSPNNIFQLPLFTIRKFEFSQQFSLYENNYWLPIEYHILAEFRFRFFNITLDTNSSYYKKSVICYEYKINVPIDDSIQYLSSLTLLPNSYKGDTTRWNDVVVFPLTEVEKKSYEKISELVKSQPFYVHLPQYYLQYEKQLKYLNIRYNRVEGLYLGGTLQYPDQSIVRLTADAGFGTADKTFKYRLKPELLISSRLSLWFGFEHYRWINTAPVNYSVDQVTNTLSVLFDADDYFNYYAVRGNRLFISVEQSDFTAKVSLVAENQTSIRKETDFWLFSFGSKSTLRNNPPVTEGKLIAVVFDCQSNIKIENSLFEEPKDSWRVRFEHSLANNGSSFDFTSLYSTYTFRIPTMGKSRLFNPYLGISASIGKSFGSVPLQRTFALESPLSRFVFPGSFRTVNNTEFLADNFYSLAVEHNFRNIPFILLGIPSVNFDLIVRAATANMWTTTAALKNSCQSFKTNYNEYTLGIGRVFDIFRIDFSYSTFQHVRYTMTFAGNI